MSTEEDGFNSKNWVWIPDTSNNFFSKGYITDYLQDGTCKVVIVNGNQETHKTVPQDSLENCNPAKFNKCHDMAELTHLNEPSVVYNLYLRYSDDMIYTYSGLFLVAINPYKVLQIYDSKMLKKYHLHDFDKPPPHIFATAEGTYRNLLSNKKDQSILVTGESGAGKTENTKKIIQYLSSITHSNLSVNPASPASPNPKSIISLTIDTKILQANPILESFGNAKTIKNNNSSRFGKFIRIFFSVKGTITGANIDYYLLEKSRVVSQAVEERNYHVFYQFLKGYDQLATLGLNKDISSFKYLSNQKRDIPNVDDLKEYNILVQAFNIMGLSTQEIHNIFLILAVVLHLGNLDFSSWKSEQANFTLDSPIDIIVKLLGIEETDFVNNLLRPKVKAGREFIQKSMKAPEVKYAIDAFAKHIYEKLFQYIIERINTNLNMDSDINDELLNFIGVLDIAGFEIFDVNSFEQLCINYTNEKLQQFFNHHSFILEQSEYLREDIQWEFIDFGQDLQPTIDLIETKNPMGVLAILDEECVIPKSSDSSFMEKLSSNWGKGKSSKFQENKLKSGFIIHHYAGMVEYNVDNWLQKNTDPVSEHVLQLLPDSSNEFISNLFKNDEHLVDQKKRGASNRLKTASLKHKDQLRDLMEQLERTEPHFVRCILPNLEKKANKFDKTLVLNQLRCNGVLEGIRITRAGYPNRMTFEDFYSRYAIINIKEVFTNSVRTNSELLLKYINLSPESFKIGITKIFFKNGILGKLEEMRDISLKSIYTDLQSLIRGVTARKSMQKKIKQIQSSQLIARTIKQVDDTLGSSLWMNLFVKIKPLLEESVKVLDSKEMNENLKNVSLKLKDAEKSKTNLESDNNKLRDKILLLEDQITATNDLIEQRDQSLKELRESESATSAKVLDFEQKLKTLEVLNESLKTEKSSLDEEMIQAQDKYTRKFKEFTKLDEDHNNLLSRLSDLEVQLLALKEEKKRHKDMMNELKAEHESSREVLDTDTNKLKELNSQLEKDLEKHKGFTVENEGLKKEIKQLNESISTNTTFMTTKEREISSLKSKSSHHEEEVSKLRQLLTETEVKLRENQSQLETKSRDIKHHKDAAEKLQSDCESLGLQIANVRKLEKDLLQSKSEAASLKLEIQRLEKSLASAIADKEVIQTQFEKLQVDYETLKASNTNYSERIAVLSKKVQDLEYDAVSNEQEKENHPPDPAFMEDFANIKLKLNEQSAALRKERFESKKLSEELSMLKERVSSENGKDLASSRRSLTTGEGIKFSGGIDILQQEIESMKHKLQQEETNSQRAETYAIELQKKLNKLQSTRGLNSWNDYEKKYKESQDRIHELEVKYEEMFSIQANSPKSLKSSDSFSRLSMSGANADFVTIYQDVSKTLRTTRAELTTAKSEILRLKSLLRESEDELYDAKRQNFRSSVNDYEEELAELRVRHDSLSSKNADLSENADLYKKRSEEYYVKLELAESAVNISKRHEGLAVKELTEVKNQLRLAREEARTSQILVKDIRNQCTTLEEAIQEKTFKLKKEKQRIIELNDKLNYLTTNYGNREISDTYKEELRTVHQELNFKLETETILVKENKKLLLDLEDLTREKKALDKDYEESLLKEEELEVQVNDLTTKTRSLENEKAINERKLTSMTKQITSLKDLISEVTFQRDQLLEKKEEMEEQILKLNHTLDETTGKFEDAQMDINVMRQHLENQRQESNEYKSELNQSRMSTSSEVQDYQKLRKEILITSQENDSLRKANSELGAKVHILEEKLYGNEQLRYWENKVKNLTGELNASQNDNYDASKLIKSLERTVQELSIRVQNESQLTKKYNDENFDYQNKVNHYKSTIDILHNESLEKDLMLSSKDRENLELREHSLLLEKEVLELRERLGLR